MLTHLNKGARACTSTCTCTLSGRRIIESPFRKRATAKAMSMNQIHLQLQAIQLTPAQAQHINLYLDLRPNTKPQTSNHPRYIVDPGFEQNPRKFCREFRLPASTPHPPWGRSKHLPQGGGRIHLLGDDPEVRSKYSLASGICVHAPMLEHNPYSHPCLLHANTGFTARSDADQSHL